MASATASAGSRSCRRQKYASRRHSSMSDELSDYDRWDAYAERYDPSFERERGPRKAKSPAKRPPQVEDVAEARGLEAGFHITYQPARFEKIWLEDSLRSFFDQELIV